MQPKYKLLMLACLLITFNSNLKAQFENKVTFNFSLGAIQPIGIQEYIYQSDNLHYENTFLMPYLFSNYKQGFTFTGSAQFNINRFFSVGTGIGVERIGNWEYTEAYTWNDERKERDFLSWTITSGETLLDKGTNELNLYNLSIGVFPRINLAYGKKVNPYIFTEITFNYTDINYVNNQRISWIDLGGTEEDYDEWYSSLTTPAAFKNTPQSSFGVGLYPGLGIDFNISQNLGIFIQGGYSFISINKSDLEDANLEAENFKTIKAELGVKVSFLRSKDI
ncbi:MAG TPA: outer membrane beta-barrel protein [Tenuifilaceae bacterium]|nr:outer membrane beta-barrel protein [Tenuifilaceae bacterium]HPE17640.1 outer membrane beta-barrel protein [Tenuifilaceae bacterium]HPJ44957.1 outer membrane beta-barrel protein [Tenuifilaceae bacterium]HPQ35095.1 outer membrane beta-barrel protein [Tenuifilaceae bacterium]HRX68232.1 outer membrane beta-barrel protein [Tenuifilaceae bacterium]